MKQGNPADIVYDYIKNQIVTKAIYPGTRIVEEELVRETGVSRTPVRSALMRLAYDGHPAAAQPGRRGGKALRHGSAAGV